MRKTKIASAVLLLATAGWASAQEVPASKSIDFNATADLVAAAEGNSITLTQTAPEGNEVGNVSILSQAGDDNTIIVDVVGDANEVEVTQNMTDNIFVASLEGTGNLIYAEQYSIGSVGDFIVVGDDNIIELVQLGDGGPLGLFFNRSINDVIGSGNTLSIYQGDGGNWANNVITGSNNAVIVEQTGDWHESYVRNLEGSGNYIEIIQDDFYNVADLANVIGSDNEIYIEQNGEGNNISWDMEGDLNLIEFEQDGDGNAITTGVFQGVGNELSIDQLGDDNLATVETISGLLNVFDIEQAGEGNTAYAGVIGGLNEFTLVQLGDFNEISTVNFDGYSNIVEISQDGDYNLALAQAGIGDESFIADGNDIIMEQEGVDNIASVELAQSAQSDFNIIDVEQSGELNLLDLLVDGSDNMVSVMQEGVGNWVTDETGGQFVISGDMNTFTVSQTGNDDLVSGSMTGNGGVISVTQVGDYNVATVSQM